MDVVVVLRMIVEGYEIRVDKEEVIGGGRIARGDKGCHDVGSGLGSVEIRDGRFFEVVKHSQASDDIGAVDELDVFLVQLSILVLGTEVRARAVQHVLSSDLERPVLSEYLFEVISDLS